MVYGIQGQSPGAWVSGGENPRNYRTM